MKRIKLLFVCLVVLATVLLSNSVASFAETEKAINVYSTSSALINPPTVIMEYDGEEDISTFEAEVSSSMVRPATMIVEVDEDFNVSVNGNVMAYNDFRLKYIKGKMLPAVRVESEGAKKALVDFLNTKGYDFIDFAVVSSKPELVKAVREEKVNIRGIIDYSASDISKKSAGAIANELNENKALTAILNFEQADVKKVFDIQARFKSVWVKSPISNNFDAFSAIATGATGIVTDDFSLLYNAYLSVEESTLSRGFYGIGHRGLPSKAGENTLEGMIAAYEAGATHFELDTKVCKSGEIVIMHDDGLASTTNGTGNIANMTLDEIKKYKVVKNSDGKAVTPCDIPTLEEVFTYFKGKDVVMIVETKNTDSTYPAKLKALVDKYGVAEQVVVIGFGTSELGVMAEVAPELPTANLNGTTKGDFLVYMAKINALNTAMNPSKSGFATDSWLFKNSLARGYLPYYWTMSTPSENEGAVARGAMGITTDCVDSLGGYVKNVLTESVVAYGDTHLQSGSFNIEVETYKGEKKTVSARAVAYVENGGVIEAILAYTDNGYERFTQKVSVSVEPEENKPEDSSDTQTSVGGNTSESWVDSEVKNEKKGCKSSVYASTMLSLAVVFIAIAKINKVKKR